MNRTARKFAQWTFAGLSLSAAAMAGPQLVARIDGQTVPNFSTQFFPDTLVGESSSLLVTLRNEGDSDLVFAETPPVQLSGAFAGQFALIQPALETGNKLSPNSSTAFRIDFEPTLEFAGLNANIFIFTNEAPQPYRMSVRGAGTVPALTVLADGVALADAGAYDFGDVPVGTTVEVDFEIRNDGTGELRLTGTPLADIAGGLGATVTTVTQQPDPTVAAGASTTVRVAFTPTDERPYTTRLFIASNDEATAGLFDLDLLGAGFTPDSDGDGVADDQDACPGEDDNLDSDGDGTPDCLDAFPNDPTDGQGDDQNDPNQGNDNGDPNDGNDNGDPLDPNDGGQVDPNDGADPNQVFDGDDDDDQRDPNDGFGGQDPNDYQDDNDDNNNDDDAFEDDFEDDEELITPAGLCGFGMGFASLASMASLGGLKLRRRRR